MPRRTKHFLLPILAVLSGFHMSAFNVTFRVDMSNVTGFTTPEVNATFNAWCGGCMPMSDPDGDNIWEASANLQAGTYEYQFAADNWNLQESLMAGASCTVTTVGFTNRTLSVSSNMILPIVCWGFCETCGGIPGTFNVTFQVDMSNQTGFTTPEVNGTFNGWCGNCNFMNDNDGDNDGDNNGDNTGDNNGNGNVVKVAIMVTMTRTVAMTIYNDGDCCFCCWISPAIAHQ